LTIHRKGKTLMKTIFITAAREAPLALHQWAPEGEARAVFLVIHGLGEHGGRYRHLANILTRRGCRVWAPDLRGHGLTPGKRGYTESYRHLLEDVKVLVAKAGRENPTSLLFLYGHSMGGGLVLNYLLQDPTGLAGAIVTGPLLRTADPPARARLVLARLLYRLWPGLTLASRLDAGAISRDEEVVAAYRKDPLVHDRLSFQLGWEMLTAGLWNLSQAGTLRCPLLIMHGEADRLTSCEASREFARRAGPLCTLKTWPGLCHEIHNEPEKEEVFAYLLSWLEDLWRHLPATPGLNPDAGAGTGLHQKGGF
jgi:alpha-beta hydrolase superfamily lysophospholipase